MLAGSPFRRTFNSANIADHAISFVCQDYAGGHDGDPAWAQRNDFFVRISALARCLVVRSARTSSPLNAARQMYSLTTVRTPCEPKCSFRPAVSAGQLEKSPGIATRTASEFSRRIMPGDGKNFYKSDGSHMSYPIGDVEHGPCPASHPKRFITLFFEAVFDVQDFPYRANAWTFSFGDQTGLGFHGDFIAQWDEKVLQKAIDTVSKLEPSLATSSATER